MNGTFAPSSRETATAIAVLPVPGGPARIMHLPLSLPSFIILTISPAASRAFSCPTMPPFILIALRFSSNPNPLMWVCEPIRSNLVFGVVGSSFIGAAMVWFTSLFGEDFWDINFTFCLVGSLGWLCMWLRGRIVCRG